MSANPVIKRVAAAFVGAMILSAPLPASAAVQEDARADYYQRALELIDKKDYSGAVILLKNALQAGGRDLSARVELANTYLKMEDGVSAEKELLRARRDGAQENFIIAPLGRAMLLQGRFDEVVSQISTAGTTPEVKAEILTVRGLAYLAQRRFADAAQAFDDSLGINPLNAEPNVGLARVEIARNLLDKAGDYVKQAIKLDPVNAEAWFIDAELSRLRNNKKGALASYGKAIEIAPDFHRALLARARILIDRGDFLAAEPDVLKVRKEQRRDPNAAYLHALILTAKGDVEGARDALNDADQMLKAIGPEFIRFDPPLLLLAGVVSYFRKDFESAYGQLSQYHREVPHHLGARKLLAALEMSRGHPLQAIELLEPVAQATPDDFEVQIMLGDALMRAGRTDQSAKVFEKAAQIAPTNSSAMSQLAMLRLLAGQEDAALEHLESALSRDPGASRVAVMLSLAQLKRGQNEKANETARRVAEREPKNPVPYNLIAGGYSKLKRFDDARRNFESAIAADPNYRPAISNLAKLETAQGNFDKAFELYNRLLQMDPLNGRTMIALADVEQKRGRNDETIRWLAKARVTSRHRQVASLRLVEAYINANNHELAIRTAEALQAQDPGKIIYLSVLGRAYLDGKKLEKAAQTFSDLSTRADEAGSALWVHRAGEWLERSRDADSARRSFERAVAIDPKFLPPRLALFRHDMIARNFDAAMKRADEIEKISPDSHFPDALRGDV
jgi:putative PEP-CTERM system TPR-repeat lipoprotein